MIQLTVIVQVKINHPMHMLKIKLNIYVQMEIFLFGSSNVNVERWSKLYSYDFYVEFDTPLSNLLHQ